MKNIDNGIEKKEHNLVRHWQLNAKRSQICHYDAANFFSNLNYILGIPVVLLSSALGTGVLITLEKETNFRFQIVVGIISIIIAVLAALQTFLSFGERSAKHRSVAAQYGAVKREMQQYLISNDKLDENNVEIFLNKIRSKMDLLARESPEIPNRIMKNAIKKAPISSSTI